MTSLGSATGTECGESNPYWYIDDPQPRNAGVMRSSSNASASAARRDRLAAGRTRAHLRKAPVNLVSKPDISFSYSYAVEVVSPSAESSRLHACLAAADKRDISIAPWNPSQKLPNRGLATCCKRGPRSPRVVAPL